MKTAYTSDNTRSSIAILLSLAVVVTAIAALIGLSDKPDVSIIVISPAGEAPIIAVNNFGFVSSDDATGAAASDAVVLDELGQPFDDSSTDSESDSRTSNGATEARTAPEGEIIVVPTLEPTPTPEIAAAVEPTPVPDDSSDTGEPAASTALSPSLPTTSGTVQGTFFTKGDENDGAVVAQNLITVSFAEDGSGAFQGVLDITYANDTHILLNMSGPLTWAASNPQVEATLEGAFTLDAVIDTDDVTTNDAKLSISSLEAGSGSLCTTKCFGFTFPPQ
jgi:hypothetical protein